MAGLSYASLENNLLNHDTYDNLSVFSNNLLPSKEEIIKKYQDDLDKILNYQNNILESKKDTLIKLENIDFINNVLKIKMELIELTKINKKNIDEKENLEGDIIKIEAMIEYYNLFNISLCEIFKKESDDNNSIFTNDKDLDMIPVITSIYGYNNKLNKNENKDNNQENKKNIEKYDIKMEYIENLLFKKIKLLNSKKEAIYEIYNKIKILKEVINTNDVTLENNISMLCCICNENNIQYCINPCGHTFCKNCSDRISKTCHICRANCEKKILLFFN